MNLRWFTTAIRVTGLILIVSAALIFFSGGFSFRSETQTASDTYEIHHTAVLSQSAIILGVIGVALLASSLFIRSKRV
jgi:Mn2+/Fe2+ NRAMP family transporter